MELKVTGTLHPELAIGEIDNKLYGSFLEHLGRAIYGGVYEPGHPAADANGFRKDVLELVRELNIPIVRYPGGNFVSGYNWEDGVGPQEKRPRRLELAWGVTETNQFGLNEFIQWCREANTEPMMAVNLGTRGPDEARSLVEYCNHPSGSHYSDLRREHGAPEPHNIKYWCLGNEMDGRWQIGHKTAEEYGRIAAETAHVMYRTDPDLKLILCGSTASCMPTYPDWDLTVLDHAYDSVDYLSLHTYLGNQNATQEEFLARPQGMLEYIHTMISACDVMKAKKRSKKTIYLSFDEWNVWSHKNDFDVPENKWTVAPPQLQDEYSMIDALVFGSMMINLIKHAHRIRIGCQAQLVNVIAPIITENGGPAWRQTIFYPYLHGSLYGRGTALNLNLRGPVYDTREFEKVPYVDAVATSSESGVTVFAINRHLKEEIALELDIRAHKGLKVLEHLEMRHDSLETINTRDNPNAVRPSSVQQSQIDEGKLTVRLSPASWNTIRLA